MAALAGAAEGAPDFASETELRCAPTDLPPPSFLASTFVVVNASAAHIATTENSLNMDSILLGKPNRYRQVPVRGVQKHPYKQ